ncbi:MAG: hypothetical protein KKD17_00575 [Nanoarchaeota archaeon]|nr:hypothetical protein [Nanoarchaeota archaeon]
MKMLMVFVVVVVLAASLVCGVTLTSDATVRVDSPAVALGRICVLDASGSLTDKCGEVLFGNVNVHSVAGDTIGMVLIQFGGNIYRSITTAPVQLYRVTLRDGTVTEATSLDLPAEMESYEPIDMIGLQGKLSVLRPDGTEIYSIGETRTLSHPGKTGAPEDVAPAEFYIKYVGLVLEDTDTSRQVMTAGEYEDLVVTVNLPGGVQEKYKVVEVTSTNSFDWVPAAEVPK